jgi:general secretion pathway protein D
MKKRYSNIITFRISLLLSVLFGLAIGAMVSSAQVLPPPGNIPPPPSIIPPFPGTISAPPSFVPPGLPPSANPEVPGVPVAPPVTPTAPVIPPSMDPLVEETGFVGAAGLFSDPVELAGIEGLDEPLDRIKLRDLPGKEALEMIQLWTERYILRPQNLPQIQLNFDSFNVLTKREALMAVESLLTMNGIAITKIDDRFWKAVPALGVNAQVPIWLEGPATALSPSQRIYIKMFHLKYAPALEVQAQLNAFATPNVSSLILFEKANSLLITDSLLNLQRMEKLLETIDRPVRKEDLGTEFFVWEMKHASAKELETKLKAMIEGSLKPFLGGTTQVDSDDRTGKLLVVTRSQNLETIQFILETLDAPVKMKTTSKLFKLQHAESKEIKAILDEVINKQQGIKQKVQGRSSSSIRPVISTASKPPTPKTSAKPVASAASTDPAGEGSHEFSDFITIASDDRSNAILVYGTKEDIDEIGGMIESLDHPLPMARIDTIFVMVDLTEQNQRGIDALFKDLQWSKYDRETAGEGEIFGKARTSDSRTEQTVNPVTGETETVIIEGDSAPIVSNALSGALSIPGLNSFIPFQMTDWTLTGIRWDQIFAQSLERNDVRIFSSPTLMLSHNAESVYIRIEDERNIVVPSYYGSNTGGAGSTSSTGNTQSFTAKTELEIKKPKIGLPQFDDNGTLSSSGSVYMQIKVTAQKFDETQANTYQEQNVPGMKSREAESWVTVRDGEIIVLGGLQEVQVDSTETRYNLLSSIPYLGKKFFRPKTVKYTPTELLIFLRPTIIRPDDNNTDKHIQEIDQRLVPEYVPRFTSPSGTVLNAQTAQTSKEKINRTNDLTERDEPSTIPFLSLSDQ